MIFCCFTSIKKNGDDIFYYLTSINDKLQNSKVSIIGITNNAKFRELLSTRIQSRLGEENITFPPYNATQIIDILNERVKEAFDEDVLDESVIGYCAAFTAKEGGDARKALDLLRMSADIAERNGDDKITYAHVISAENMLEKNAVIEIVKTLNDHSKIVLMSIILNTENGQNVMITGDVYSTYHYVCSAIGIQPLSQRRVSDFISELDMLGIVHARVKSFGRNGRTKDIELSIPQDVIDLVKKDSLFSDLGKYKSKKQTTLI